MAPACYFVICLQPATYYSADQRFWARHNFPIDCGSPLHRERSLWHSACQGELCVRFGARIREIARQAPRDRSSVVEQKMEDKNVGRRTEGREHKLHIPVLPETYCQQYADDWQRERNTSMRVKHERAHAPAIRGRNALAAPDSGTLSQQLFARLIEPA